MPEQIFTFTDEEVERMFKSGELRLLAVPSEPAQKIKTEHEKALEKTKRLFGKDFEDVETLEIGGKLAGQLKQALNQANINTSPWAENILDSLDFITLPNPQNIKLIKLKVQDLGFNHKVTTNQIYTKAQELGLGLCFPEVGVYQRLKDTHQPLNEWYYIAMKPIADSNYVPGVFALERWESSGLWLRGRLAHPVCKRDPKDVFLFSLRDDT